MTRSGTPSPAPDRPAELLVVTAHRIGARLIAEQLEPVGLRRITCVHSEHEGLAAVQAFKFDAAIIDIELPDGNGINVVGALQGMTSPSASVLMGDDVDDGIVRVAMLVGVCACLRKPLRPELLQAAALHAVDSTRLWRRCLAAVPGERDARRVAEGRRPPKFGPEDVRNAELTPREHEVLALLLEGYSNQRMASSLGVTKRTVKYHVTNVLRKLGARSRISLLASHRRTVGRTPTGSQRLS
jgi:DNA-binding NarL/FixJ family response regulator